MPCTSLQIPQIRSVVSHLNDRAHFGRMETKFLRVSPNAGQGRLESLVKLSDGIGLSKTNSLSAPMSGITQVANLNCAFRFKLRNTSA